MVLEKGKLLEFLNAIIVKGSIEVSEAVFKGEGNTLETYHISKDTTFAFLASLTTDICNWGEVGVNNLKAIKNYVNSFSAEYINFEKDGKNKLTLSSDTDKHCVTTTFIKPEYIINVAGKDKILEVLKKGMGNEFTFSLEQIKQLNTYFTTIGNAQLLTLIGSGERLEVKMEKLTDFISAGFDISTLNEDFEITINMNIMNVLNSLKAPATISIKKNAPVYIKTENESYKIEYLLSPQAQV